MYKEFVYSLAVLLNVMGLALLTTEAAFAQPPATGPFNVRTYGATGASNCALDTAGINAALAAVPPSGGEIYFPAGTYCLTNSLNTSLKSIAYRGEGQKLSILRWDSPGNGIVFDGNPNHSLSVKSLSLVKNNGVTGTAIWAIWSGRAITSTVNITDVAITHSTINPGWNGWDYGIHLIHAANAMIHQLDFAGPTGDVGSVAVLLAGQTLHASITKSSITFIGDAIVMTDNSEGLHVTDVEIVGTERGIVIDSGEGNLPGTSISNNHMSTSQRGIYIKNHGDVAVANNLLYSTVNSSDYMGIRVVNSDSLRITGNQIVRLGTTGFYNGIVIEGTSPMNVISNNVTDRMDTGIWLAGTGVTANLVTGNINRNFSVAPILDGGPPSPSPNQNNFANNH